MTNDTELIASTSKLTGSQIRARLDTIVSTGYATGRDSMQQIVSTRFLPVLPSIAAATDQNAEDAFLPVLLHPWESIMPTSPSWSAVMAARSTAGLPNRPQECETPPQPPAWLNASALFDQDLWQEQYCLIRCSAAQAFDARAIMRNCPFVVSSVADSVLVLQELKALQQLAQVLDEDDTTIERWKQLQFQVARGIRYALQVKVQLPLLLPSVAELVANPSAVEGFEADNTFFADGFFNAPLTDAAMLQPTAPTLLPGLVLAQGASAVAALPALVESQAQQSAQNTDSEAGSDDAEGDPTWSQQVASVLLSGSFMPPPFVPSMARAKGRGAPSTPPGFNGQSLTFNASLRARGPVWLRVNWMLATAASTAGMGGVAGGLISSTVQAVCNTSFPDGIITELYSAADGTPLAGSTNGRPGDTGAALAWLLVGPSPPPFSVPARPSAIVSLAIAVLIELIFVMMVGVACIGIGVQFMRDITVGDQAVLGGGAADNGFSRTDATRSHSAGSTGPSPRGSFVAPYISGGGGGGVA